jgi:hypothetical protein
MLEEDVVLLGSAISSFIWRPAEGSWLDFPATYLVAVICH